MREGDQTQSLSLTLSGRKSRFCGRDHSRFQKHAVAGRKEGMMRKDCSIGLGSEI